MDIIKVLVVDDQQLIREGLEMMLSIQTNIEVIDTVTNGKEALELLESKSPDIVLLDIRMPVMDGVETTGHIKEKFPNIKVIILTTFDEDEYIFEALNNGASGYLLKDVPSDEIIRGIETVYAGNTLLGSKIGPKVVAALSNKKREKKVPPVLKELTPREREIAQLVSTGKTNQEIAEELFITEGTVKNHITRVFSKLEVRDRTKLAVLINKLHD